MTLFYGKWENADQNMSAKSRRFHLVPAPWPSLGFLYALRALRERETVAQHANKLIDRLKNGRWSGDLSTIRVFIIGSQLHRGAIKTVFLERFRFMR